MLTTKKLNLAFLLAYLFFIISVTVLSRAPFLGLHFQPKLFWSWSVPRLREQIIMNVIGFVPVGFLLASVYKSVGKNPWLAVPIAALFSLMIEFLQLVTVRGLFEFDDVFHNSLGALIGVGLYYVALTLFNWLFH